MTYLDMLHLLNNNLFQVVDQYINHHHRVVLDYYSHESITSKMTHNNYSFQYEITYTRINTDTTCYTTCCKITPVTPITINYTYNFIYNKSIIRFTWTWLIEITCFFFLCWTCTNKTTTDGWSTVTCIDFCSIATNTKTWCCQSFKIWNIYYNSTTIHNILQFPQTPSIGQSIPVEQFDISTAEPAHSWPPLEGDGFAQIRYTQVKYLFYIISFPLFYYSTYHTWRYSTSTCTTTRWENCPSGPITIDWTWLCGITRCNINRRTSTITTTICWQRIRTWSNTKQNKLDYFINQNSNLVCICVPVPHVLEQGPQDDHAV
jgi:hypothetical protein